jgi:hypothetical protein
MKKYVVLALALCAAGAVLAATADVAPNPGIAAVPGPSGYNPAFGTLIRSWIMSNSGSGTYTATGVADAFDNYLIIGAWSGWTSFVTYTTTGSLVKTTGVSTATGGYRDGSGTNHLGTNYIVTIQNTAGPYYYSYTAGGTPGGTGTSLFTGPLGRGIAWDGTYYYATIGQWSSPIGKYTSTGSLVTSFTGPYSGGLYGICSYTGAAYIYAINQSPHYVYQLDKSTGSVLQSFATAGTSSIPEGGGDMGPEAGNGYLYVALQNGATASPMYVYDSGELIGNAVAPASLGKIKTLYR